jgi:hypothetical protein
MMGAAMSHRNEQPRSEDGQSEQSRASSGQLPESDEAGDNEPGDNEPGDNEPVARETPGDEPEGSGADDERPLPLTAAQRVSKGAGEVLGTALEAGERIADLGQPVAERVRTTARATARRWRSSRPTRQQYLRRLGREPLPNLFEVHPGARMAPRREVGLRTIPVDEIRGTAVEGPAQRGSDFLPLPAFRGKNWSARWRRIRDALERMAVLPPIEVLSTPDGYWVVDGHNRVAAALYNGQVEIDALVTAVRLPGEAPELTPEDGSIESLQAMLADSADGRAAGSGMLTRGASLLPPRVPAPPPVPSLPPDSKEDGALEGSDNEPQPMDHEPQPAPEEPR